MLAAYRQPSPFERTHNGLGVDPTPSEPQPAPPPIDYDALPPLKRRGFTTTQKIILVGGPLVFLSLGLFLALRPDFIIPIKKPEE